MTQTETKILDAAQIKARLRRMAFQIWERNSDEEEIILAGIQGGGETVAKKLQEILAEISPLKVQRITISINKKQPLECADLNQEIDEKTAIVLVDDVANSGRTLLYALKPILEKLPRRISIAVLIDRTHKSFPICADIVGHSLATTLQENIVVNIENQEITGAWLA